MTCPYFMLSSHFYGSHPLHVIWMPLWKSHTSWRYLTAVPVIHFMHYAYFYGALTLHAYLAPLCAYDTSCQSFTFYVYRALHVGGLLLWVLPTSWLCITFMFPVHFMCIVHFNAIGTLHVIVLLLWVLYTSCLYPISVGFETSCNFLTLVNTRYFMDLRHLCGDPPLHA